MTDFIRMRIGDRMSAGAMAGPALLWVLLAIPWLNPFASGPSSSIGPWLVSAICAAIALGLQRPGMSHPAGTAALAGLAAWAVWQTGVSPETLALAAACLLVLMAAAIAAGGSPTLVRAMALAWLLAAAASTAIALFQYFGFAEPLAPWVNTSAVGEAFANLRQRNQFASLTVIGMASLLWLVPRDIGRWPAMAAIAWLALGNAVTTSRTGLLQMVLLGLLACVWQGPRRQRVELWLVGLLAYFLAALAMPWLLEAVTGAAGNHLWDRVAAVDACSSRRVLWSNVLHLIGLKPGLGWGWGELDFAHYATLYASPRFCDILDNAHNLPLHLAVELGIPAALLICGGLLWAAFRARPWGEADPARQMAWAVLVVIGVHSLLEYPLWYGPFQIAFGLCLGLLWPGASRPALHRESLVRSHATALMLSVAVAAACAYAAWDYRRVSQIYLPQEARAAGYADDPLAKIRTSWLFRNQAGFAELTTTPLTRANAQWTFETATALLHYSPEPRVIEKLIESAVLLGRDEEARWHLARFRAAFPQAHATWAQTRASAAPPASTPQTQPAT
jgi:O-antigen ligase